MSLTPHEFQSERPLARFSRHIGFSAVLLIVVGVLALLAYYGFTGFFSRYMADDYCVDGAVQQRGYFGFIYHIYTNFFGRFSYLILAGLLTYLPPASVQFLPVIVILIGSVGISLTIYLLVDGSAEKERFLSALALGSLVVLLPLASSSNVIQSLYWKSGMLHLVPPFLMYAWYAPFFIWARRNCDSKITLAITVLWFFFAAGFIETTAVVQLTVLTLAVLVARIRLWHQIKKYEFQILLAALLGTVFGVVMLIGAPGNAVRLSLLGSEYPSIVELLSRTLWWSYLWLRWWALNFALFGLGIVAVSFSIGYLLQREIGQSVSSNSARVRPLMSLFGIGFGGYILVVVSFLPAMIAADHMPANRTLLVPLILLCCSLLLAGFTAGKLARQWFSQGRVVNVGIASMMLLLAAINAVQIYDDIDAHVPIAREFSVAWDDRDRIVRSAISEGKRDIEVPTVLEPGLLDQLSSEPTFWINICVASYYQIDSIQSR